MIIMKAFQRVAYENKDYPIFINQQLVETQADFSYGKKVKFNEFNIKWCQMLEHKYIQYYWR